MRILVGSIAAIVLALTAGARAAEEWGIDHEKVAQFTARVVDVACALKGDCPANCGDGRRQLGFLSDDGKLRVAAKGSTDFAGAVHDLLPYCGKTIEVDGLLIENPAITIYMAQRIREGADKPWIATTRFAADWEARHGKTEQWFRDDPLVKEVIAEDGVLGIKGLAPPVPK